jgi:hypothetical protein
MIFIGMLNSIPFMGVFSSAAINTQAKPKPATS